MNPQLLTILATAITTAGLVTVGLLTLRGARLGQQVARATQLEIAEMSEDGRLRDQLIEVNRDLVARLKSAEERIEKLEVEARLYRRTRSDNALLRVENARLRRRLADPAV